GIFGTHRSYIERFDDLGGNCPDQWRRNGVADLPRAMPFRRVKTEPVGIAVQPRHFPHGNAARIGEMNRPGAGEGAARAVCTGPKCVAQAFGGELEKPADRLDAPWFGLRKAPLRYLRVRG